jgi:hypothetical protein
MSKKPGIPWSPRLGLRSVDLWLYNSLDRYVQANLVNWNTQPNKNENLTIVISITLAVVGVPQLISTSSLQVSNTMRCYSLRKFPVV